MTRELCIVCGVAYVDSSGRCPNGCTDKISRDLKKALQGDQDALKRLEDLKPGIQKSKAHTWGLQHGFKPKKNEPGSGGGTGGGDSDDNSGSGGYKCPNCGETNGHAEWCPYY